MPSLTHPHTQPQAKEIPILFGVAQIESRLIGRTARRSSADGPLSSVPIPATTSASQ